MVIAGCLLRDFSLQVGLGDELLYCVALALIERVLNQKRYDKNKRDSLHDTKMQILLSVRAGAVAPLRKATTPWHKIHFFIFKLHPAKITTKSTIV
jgi:hypothetical protein